MHAHNAPDHLNAKVLVPDTPKRCERKRARRIEPIAIPFEDQDLDIGIISDRC